MFDVPSFGIETEKLKQRSPIYAEEHFPQACS